VAPLRLAHRGDHRRAPENTLAALEAALTVPGCDGLEFDVRSSREGVPILLHDPTLQRVQGRPDRPADLTVAELAALGVPTLESALALSRPADDAATTGLSAPPPFLDVELKEDVTAATMAVIRAARGDPPARLVVSSFEPDILAALGRLAPRWLRWLNAEDLAPATIDLARDLGCAGISAWHPRIDGAAVERARTAGLVVAAWTVVAPTDAERLGRLGVVAMCVEGDALWR
jgi:glycerophosphoryl diester phosphodiesterase